MRAYPALPIVYTLHLHTNTKKHTAHTHTHTHTFLKVYWIEKFTFELQYNNARRVSAKQLEMALCAKVMAGRPVTWKKKKKRFLVLFEMPVPIIAGIYKMHTAAHCLFTVLNKKRIYYAKWLNNIINNKLFRWQTHRHLHPRGTGVFKNI